MRQVIKTVHSAIKYKAETVAILTKAYNFMFFRNQLTQYLNPIARSTSKPYHCFINRYYRARQYIASKNFAQH